jgi:cell pole-organizing protein PopZ
MRMTQPAKSQEPSMEEILASIRRIIADDDAGRIAKRASDAPSAPEASEAHDVFGQPAEPPRPSFSAPPEPSIPEAPAETLADSTAMRAAEEDYASEILDLTESMTARMFSEPEPAPAPSPVPDATPEFREPEPAREFHEPEPEPEARSHEPEPAPQFYAREPEPQFHEPEPEPAPQMQEPEPAPQFHVTENYSDAHVEEAAEKPAVPPRSEPSVRYVAPETEWRGAADRGAGERGAGERGPLLSSATSAAVDSAFNALAHTVLVQNARTLEDLVREMLRPMLKTWLDDNLPGLVERLVRAEIERVARGR